MLSVTARGEVEHSHEAICPSCKQHTTFQFAGEQRIPQNIAEKLQIPAVIPLWSCDSCRTTLSEEEIDF
jgi:hypothetical protein